MPLSEHGCQMAIYSQMDCAPTPSTLAQSKERKGSNFAIWQHCAKATVELIKARLEEDAAARAEGRAGDVGLSAAFQRASILANQRDEQRVEIARMAAAAAASKAPEATNGDSRS